MKGNTIYWFSKLSNIEKMAKEQGYAVENGAPVVRIELSEIFASPKVEQAMNRDITEEESLIFGELWQYQVSDILETLRSRGINKDEEWIKGFDGELSQAVYDEEDNLQAFIMCSGDKDGIFVHLLLSLSDDTKPLIALLKGFLNTAWDWEGGKDAISMVVANEKINELMDKMLHKRTHKKELGKVHYIEDGSGVEAAFIDALAEAEGTSFIQGNISWKMTMEEK